MGPAVFGSVKWVWLTASRGPHVMGTRGCLQRSGKGAPAPCEDSELHASVRCSLLFASALCGVPQSQACWWPHGQGRHDPPRARGQPLRSVARCGDLLTTWADSGGAGW